MKKLIVTIVLMPALLSAMQKLQTPPASPKKNVPLVTIGEYHNLVRAFKNAQTIDDINDGINRLNALKMDATNQGRQKIAYDCGRMIGRLQSRSNNDLFVDQLKMISLQEKKK